jgi:hypothetical protein
MIAKMLGIFLAAAYATWGAEVHPSPLTRHDFAAPVFTDHGSGFVPGRRMTLDIVSANPKLRKTIFMLIYDPETTRYLWDSEYVPDGFPDNLPPIPEGNFIYSGSARLTSFWIVAPKIVVLESQKTAGSLDEAEQKALSEKRVVESEMEQMMTSKTPVERPDAKRVKFVPFGDLGEEFFSPPLSARAGPVKLLDLVRKGNHWEATIQGQWKERLDIDDNYKVIGKEQIK